MQPHLGTLHASESGPWGALARPEFLWGSTGSVVAFTGQSEGAFCSWTGAMDLGLVPLTADMFQLTLCSMCKAEKTFWKHSLKLWNGARGPHKRTHTHTHSARQIHTHSDRQTHTHTLRQADTHVHTLTHSDRQTHTHTLGQADTHTHSGRQTHTHTHTHSDRQTHTHTHTLAQTVTAFFCTHWLPPSVWNLSGRRSLKVGCTLTLSLWLHFASVALAITVHSLRYS